MSGRGRDPVLEIEFNLCRRKLHKKSQIMNQATNAIKP